ncbi:MAG: aspartate-semialdehyde dehydrogenase [Bacteroidia bacterium]
MKIAIVGATGLVGTKMMQVLEERNFPFDDFIPVASERSAGKEIEFKGEKYKLLNLKQGVEAGADIALFSAGGSVSLEWAPKFASAGTTVIDNSSAWRMDPNIKLVVPEINGMELTTQDKIIANPNCSTIQLVMVIAPLHKKYKIRRMIISTYQSVTGTGQKAVDQFENERNGNSSGPKIYPHAIDRNCIPQCDVFLDNGYTKEEMKMVNETKKILNDNSIKITATAVRVPVMGGHSESVNLEFEKEFDLSDVRKLLSSTPGVIVQDEPHKSFYPMPLFAHDKDEVFVGRIRHDDSQPNSINLWIVSDNLRKGAATNAVQIAEYLVKKNYFEKEKQI